MPSLKIFFICPVSKAKYKQINSPNWTDYINNTQLIQLHLGQRWKLPINPNLICSLYNYRRPKLNVPLEFGCRFAVVANLHGSTDFRGARLIWTSRGSGFWPGAPLGWYRTARYFVETAISLIPFPSTSLWIQQSWTWLTLLISTPQ